jgi:acyl carrier protein
MTNPRAQIRDFVVQNFLFGQADGLTDEASFLDRGIIDSTGVLELVAYIEKTFEVKVHDDELIPENLDSINAVAGYLQRKLAAAPEASAQ